MLAFQVVQRAVSVRARVPGALSLSCSIMAHPYSTKPPKLPSRKLVFGGPDPLLSTFSGLAKSAKTSKKLLEWFPAISVGKDLFEIKWGGVCDELEDLSSAQLKTYASVFFPEDTFVGKRPVPFFDFYLGVLEEEQLEADDAQLKSCTLAYFGLKQIVVSIGMSGDFVNDKVKRLMKDLIMAPLYPNWELFEESLAVSYSTTTLPNQELALQVQGDVSWTLPNLRYYKGVTDAALWKRMDGTQLLIGEGKDDSRDCGLPQVLMAMLVQCAKSACTEPVIWGFVLDPDKYTIIKLEVIGEQIVVKEHPPNYHKNQFVNFLPLMGLSEYTAKKYCTVGELQI